MKDITFYTSKLWEMSKCTTSRRELFMDGDRLKFTEIDATNVRLVVYKKNTSPTTPDGYLAGHIFLELVNGELVGSGYGRRKLHFKPRQIDATDSDFRGIRYGGDFANGAGHQPDEGGDGDPR